MTTADGQLDDARLFDLALPAGWLPLVALLGELEAVLDDAGADPADKQARARGIRQRLLEGAGPLAGSAPAELKPQSPSHQRWFTEAVLLWTHFSEAGGRILIDTHNSEILQRFRPDLIAGADEQAAIRAALRRTFGWSEPELARIEGEVLGRISNLRVKNAIAAALATGLSGGWGESSVAASSRQLFQRLYGPIPFRTGEVTLTLTTTTLIIGLPFDNGQLIAAEQPPRPESDRRSIEAFLALVEKYKNTFDTLRFPGFGLYDRRQVEPSLLRELTAAVNATPGLESVHPQVVVETLATMVTLVPSQQAELFLLHDIWGHGWEESLGDFEWSYARLLELRDPVQAATGPRFAGEQAPALREAFREVEGRTELEPAALRQVVASDLRGRITVGLNVVVSEALADLVEHKYQRRRGPGDPPLPSSSLFPDAPLKLDLSLRDTQTLLKAAHRSYRRLLERPPEAARLVAELAANGLPEPGLQQAVAQALALIREEFAHVLATGLELPAQGGNGGERAVNLAQRVMLGMVGLQAALVEFLDQADARCGDMAARQAGGRLWRCPSACIDLLVLLLGCFYEQDRRLFFWHLDELLRDELGPTLARFEAALNESAP